MERKTLLISSIAMFNGNRWGRTFPIAKSLAKKKVRVTLLVNAKLPIWELYRKYRIDDVKIITINRLLPEGILITPFFFISLNFWIRLIYSCIHKYSVTLSDCSELATSGIPCLVNKYLYKSLWFSEYADLLGEGGYYDRKPIWFKILNGRYYLWAIKFFRKKADFVIVLSNVMKNYIEKEFKIKPSKILIVPGGSRVDSIAYYKPHNKKKIKLGYIGIGSYELEGIMPILQVVKNKFSDVFSIEFYGDYLPEKILENYEIKDIVHQNGWVDVVSGCNLIKETDVFMIMRKNKLIGSMGWPNKLGDYLSFGRPILIEPYGDLMEFTKEHEKAFYIINQSSSNIECRLKEIFDDINSRNGELFTEKCDYCRELAESEISWDSRVLEINNKINNIQ